MKKSGYPLIMFIVLFLFSISGWADQKELTNQETREMLHKISAGLSQNKSLRARFVQERHLVMFDDVLRSYGFFYYRNPGDIRWEFTKPYASITILLGTGDVAKFDITDHNLVKVKTGSRQVLAEVLTQISLWQKGDLSHLEEDFKLSMFAGDHYQLILTPLSSAIADVLRKLVFEIDPHSYLVHSIKLFEDEQNYTVIRFSEQKVNEILADKLFDLNKPSLVEIQ